MCCSRCISCSPLGNLKSHVPATAAAVPAVSEGIQCDDGVERKRGGDPALADLEPSCKPYLYTHPVPPLAVIQLEREQRREVALHAQTDGHPGQHAHGKRDGIAGASRALKDALRVGVAQGVRACRVASSPAAKKRRGNTRPSRSTACRPGRPGARARRGPPSSIWACSCSAPTHADTVRVGTVGVEQAENVQGDDRVRACSLGIKI